MIGREYTAADLERQITGWHAAAEAFNRGEIDGVMDAFRPTIGPEDPMGQFRDLLAMTVLGARLTATRVMHVTQKPYAPPPPGYRHQLTVHPTDPREELSAAQRLAGQAVVMAANHDVLGVVDLVVDWAVGADKTGFPDQAGAKRLVDLTVELLLIYIEHACFTHKEEGST